MADCTISFNLDCHGSVCIYDCRMQGVDIVMSLAVVTASVIVSSLFEIVANVVIIIIF